MRGRQKSKDEYINDVKKRRKKNYTLYYTILFLVMIIIGVILSLTVFFNIAEITISGNSEIMTAEVIEVSEIKLGSNLLRVNTSAIKKRIVDKYIFVDDVIVKRKFPATLELVLKKAVPVAAVLDGEYSYFSAGGRLIERCATLMYPQTPQYIGLTLSPMELGEYMSEKDKEQLATINLITNEATKQKFKDITAVDISDYSNVLLYYQNRIEIKLGGITDIDRKLRLAKKIIETIGDNEKGVLDVQILDKGYFRPKAIELPSAPIEQDFSDIMPDKDTSSGDVITDF